MTRLAHRGVAAALAVSVGGIGALALGVGTGAAQTGAADATTASGAATGGQGAVIVPEKTAAEFEAERRAEEDEASAAAAAAAEARSAEDDEAAARAAEAAAQEQERLDAEAAEEGVGASRSGRPNLLTRGNLGSVGAAVPSEQLSGRVSFGASYESDPGLDDGGAGYRVSTSFGLSYVTVGRSDRFELSTQLSLSTGRGDGFSGSDSLSVPLPNLSLGYSQSVNRSFGYGLSFSGGVRRLQSSGSSILTLTDADGDGVLEFVQTQRGSTEAYRLSLSGSASGSYKLDRLNSFSSSVSLSRIDFINGDTQRPLTSWSLGGGWSHLLAPDLSAGLSTRIGGTIYDEQSSGDSTTVSATGNLSWSVNDSLGANFSVGPRLTFDDEGTNLGLSLSSAVSYADTETRRYTASLSNRVAPTSDGNSVNLTALRFSASEALNDRLGFELSSTLSHRSALGGSGGDDVDAVDASAGLRWALTPDVSASISYTFEYESTDTDSFLSHGVSLTLSRSFTFLP